MLCRTAQVYFNDIWRSSLMDNSPDTWTPLQMHSSAVGSPRSPNSEDRPYSMPWEPRTGHQVVLEQGARRSGLGFFFFLFSVCADASARA
jgi:hypothetical protein